MARSKIMNMSWIWNNVGFCIVCGITLGALFAVNANGGTAQNNWGYSISVAVSTGFWVVLAIPWFLWEKKRPGPRIARGDNYVTFGFKQVWFTMRQAWKLKQTFFYLVAFFLLADGIGTTTTLIAIAQTQTVLFSVTENTYLILVQGGSAIVSVSAVYALQRRFRIRTKIMLQVANFTCLLLPLWGMVGIWTTKFGFHNLWEFWAFAGLYGVTLGIQFSYGQAFMAELVPKGREYMFFSLLGIVSKGSAWIGPIVSSAIVNDTGNEWTAFPWIAALIFVPWVGIFFISEEKSRKECAEYLANEAKDLRKVTST
jgi:MFS-type transporter involved in bile tolerance (Atg22 family)